MAEPMDTPPPRPSCKPCWEVWLQGMQSPLPLPPAHRAGSGRRAPDRQARRPGPKPNEGDDTPAPPMSTTPCPPGSTPDFDSLEADDRFRALTEAVFLPLLDWVQDPCAGPALRIRLTRHCCALPPCPTPPSPPPHPPTCCPSCWWPPASVGQLPDRSQRGHRQITIAALYLRLVLGHGDAEKAFTPAGAVRHPGDDLHPRRYPRAVRPHPLPAAGGRKCFQGEQLPRRHRQFSGRTCWPSTRLARCSAGRPAAG